MSIHAHTTIWNTQNGLQVIAHNCSCYLFFKKARKNSILWLPWMIVFGGTWICNIRFCWKYDSNLLLYYDLYMPRTTEKPQYWKKLICSPSSCNLCWDITSSLESHSNTRCADQPYLIAEGCVCMCVFVCILGSILRTGCLAPYVCSVRGNWENKVLRGPLCYCYLLPPRVVFEDRKYESDRSPRGMWQWFIHNWPLTYPLHPRLVSHTHSLGPETLSPGPEFENSRLGLTRLSLTQAAQWTPHSEICLGDQWKTDGLWKGLRRREWGRGRRSRSLVKYLWRKITQGRCLITSICLAWFCWEGHVVTPAALRLIFPHYLILMYKKRVALDSVGGLW